jgi:hypothetical protein
MALDKTSLYNAILAIWQSNDGSKTVVEKAQAMADAIDTYVKTGTVSVATGNVSGTCPAGGGPLTNGAATNGTIN